jgi:hypothetical protein
MCDLHRIPVAINRLLRTSKTCVKMKIFTKLLVLALFSLPLLSQAAGKTASAAMQVSFEVKESCNVQATPAALASTANTARLASSPAVACQLNSPYMATRSGDKASSVAVSTSNSTTSSADTSALRHENDGAQWTIYF